MSGGDAARTGSLRAAGADKYAAESAEWRLRQRVAALADDGRTGLFFGRLDYDDSADPPRRGSTWAAGTSATPRATRW